MKGSIGPVLLIPSRLAAQPHWKTAVTSPKQAPAVRRFISAATAGIRRLRKTAVSRRNESSTTIATKRGSLLLSTPAKSSEVAVWPPIRTCKPALLESGTTWFRRLCRRLGGDASGGEPGGKTSAVGTPGGP